MGDRAKRPRQSVFADFDCLPSDHSIQKMDMPTHIAIAWDKLLPSVVQCEQVRVVDVRDDWKYIVTLPPEIMEHIDAALRNAFFYKKDVGGV